MHQLETPAALQEGWRPQYRRGSVPPRTVPVRKRRPACIEVNDPGIPGANNWWCVNNAAARSFALRQASLYGPGYRIAHDSQPIRGWPHYHILDPSGSRLSGHFFYGGRPPRRIFSSRPGREFESGADHFVVATKVLGGIVRIPEGHEVLTRRGAAGLPFTTAEISALIEGVRRVDTVPLRQHFQTDQQKRHFLRRAVCTNMTAARNEAAQHLILLHRRALGASSRLDAMRWIGEALHLIQDSFSEAHTQRRWNAGGPPHPIAFIRFFGASGLPAPVEHRVVPPPDPRDLIATSSGLKPSAAHAVVATREFLTMMLRHLASPSSLNLPRLLMYINRHLSLSPTRIEPSKIYPQCRP